MFISHHHRILAHHVMANRSIFLTPTTMLRNLILSSSFVSISSGSNDSDNIHLMVRIPPFNSRTSTTRQIQQLTKEMLEPFSFSSNISRKMKDSYIEIILPFSIDEKLREEYMNVYGGIRFGKIIEDIDALAGSIAYKHSLVPTSSLSHQGSFSKSNDEQSLPITIVTASVDRIDLQQKLNIHENLKLSGCVSYVGNIAC